MPKKNQEPQTGIVYWEHLFSVEQLETAEDIVQNGESRDGIFTEHGAVVYLRPRIGRGRWYHPSVRYTPQSYSDSWSEEAFTCDCARGRQRFDGLYSMCAHEAALMKLYEKFHGPWEFTETQEELNERLEEEERKRERKRRREQKKKEEAVSVPLLDLLPEHRDPSNPPYFDLNLCFEGIQTNLYRKNRALDILQKGEVDFEKPDIEYNQDGAQLLYADASVSDGGGSYHPRITFLPDRYQTFRCSCCSQSYGWSPTPPDLLCEHALVLIRKLWDYVEEKNPGDATDLAAVRFFEMLDSADIVLYEEESSGQKEKPKTIELTPRITMESGSPKLSFTIGHVGERTMVLKKIREFVSAVENEKEFDLSKTTSFDFSKADFTDDSLPWLTFIQRKIGDTDRLNSRLESHSRYGYASTITVLNQEPLEGATLDRFYDLAENTDCSYTSKAAGISGTVHVGHSNMRVRLQTQRLENSSGQFIGLTVTGKMPVILKGVSNGYILDDRHLSRISREEQQALLPFQRTSSNTGDIRFQVGKSKLSEFYYRVVPSLIESRYVDFEDSCSDYAQTLLPPEPSFLFRFDMEEDVCVCREFVTYDDRTYRLPPRESESDGEYHDEDQEERVERVVVRHFPDYDAALEGYVRRGDPQEMLYLTLTEALPELSRYGEVQGTERFRFHSIRPVPPIHVGVSLKSGIMDISVLSRGIEPEELLAILQSYRLKRKYYRLKSGDFVNIENDDQLASLEELMKDLQLSAEDVIQGHIQLPSFRALYLDKQLEMHDALVADRDRTYRSLIKNFLTIRDADYEPPVCMQEVLRPYQLYGYKWLRTLTEVGFGGILADEMGLGKTIQMISLLLALYEEKPEGPCLIVCPASLVFNWQEEFRRFAPQLPVEAIAGTAAARKKVLQRLSNSSGGQSAGQSAAGQSLSSYVYITSYDLLRKDISRYEDVRFSVMVLDEAQYIKNQRAALTKAVKVINARHRFALTGTPIENRLAELWSIFDFLMPGFLYSYEEFSSRFEVPIARSKDAEAAARLKQMVGPFILRRLKTDVLKDLPPKLEEVRYARFEDEQRSVYDGQVVRMKQMVENSGADGADKLRIFAELTRIRQICCDPSLLLEDYHGGSAKRQACMELVKTAMNGGHRMLLFSQFTSMLSLLEEDLKKEGIEYYKIVGSTPKERRVRMVREFNENEVPVFLISLKAGGTGLNLTGADVVIHYDPWWNLAAQNQATDRAHRIGQQNQVTVYRLIVKDTIEEKILELQEAKKDLADAILSGEGESIYSLSREELLGLL